MSTSFRKFFNSLYIRLLVIYGFTFLFILFSVGLIFKLSQTSNSRGIMRENLHQYGNYIIQDIGNPPDIGRAKLLGKKLRIDIHIEGPNLQFSTSPDCAHFHQKHCPFERDGNKHAHPMHWASHSGYHETRRGRYHYVLSHPRLRDPYRFAGAFAVGIGLIFLILCVSFRRVRKTLQPIDEMRDAALEYGKGRWKKRLKIKNEDELGQLAQTMNQMAEKIERQFRSAKELLTAVSHELRSPLARMKVALEFISDPSTRTSLNEEIDLLDRMTENLLEKERLENQPDILQKSEVELRSLLENCLASYQFKNERLELELPTSEVIAKADQNRLTLAIRNLIDNALKYSEDRVTVTLSELKESNEIEVAVQDRGPGIPEEDLPHITEAFFRSDTSRTGTRKTGGFGLGLSLTQSIASAHGGRLQIQSERNKGTTMKLIFSKE